MLGIALFFIGVVLIVNGVGLSGRMDARDSAPVNLLVGLLALFINAIGILLADTDPDLLLLQAACFLLSPTCIWRWCSGGPSKAWAWVGTVCL